MSPPSYCVTRGGPVEGDGERIMELITAGGGPYLMSVTGLRHPIARSETSGVVETDSEYCTTQFWGTSSQSSY